MSELDYKSFGESYLRDAFFLRKEILKTIENYEDEFDVNYQGAHGLDKNEYQTGVLIATFTGMLANILTRLPKEKRANAIRILEKACAL